jgi:hypothetical protein
VISDIAARLASAWDSIRIQTRTLGPAEAEPVISQILHARRALSQPMAARPDRAPRRGRMTPPGWNTARPPSPVTNRTAIEDGG